MTVEVAVLVLGLVLLSAVVCSKLADKVGVPTLILFLVVGMLLGSEGFGGIAFDNLEMAQWTGSFALMVILFNGGLATDWQAVKPVLAPGLVMSTLGVILTTLFLGLFAWVVLGSYSSFLIGTHGITLLEAFLIAAMVSSTDAAAVFSVYRTSKVQPRKKLRYLLEFESGSNDPMAVLLTTSILGLLVAGSGSPAKIIASLVMQFAFGALVGFVMGKWGVYVVNKTKLSAIGLFPILVFGVACMTFGAAYMLKGNGFLAVYIAGVILGEGIKRHKKEIANFHDGLDWMMQILMFIMLGLLVFPSQLLPVAGVSIVLALFLMLVARPLSTLICYMPFAPQKNEFAYISWVGLRGSVPIVLATFPATYGIEGAMQIFHVIFFIVLTSVFIQGLTLVPAAKWLKVCEPERL